MDQPPARETQPPAAAATAADQHALAGPWGITCPVCELAFDEQPLEPAARTLAGIHNRLQHGGRPEAKHRRRGQWPGETSAMAS